MIVGGVPGLVGVGGNGDDVSGGGGGTGRGATAMGGMGCCPDCRTASATSLPCKVMGWRRLIAMGVPASMKKWRELANSAKAATPPAAAPTVIPTPVSKPLRPGPVVLDDMQPGGGPVQPCGMEAVMVVLELPTEWPISAPMPAPPPMRPSATPVRLELGSVNVYPSPV